MGLRRSVGLPRRWVCDAASGRVLRPVPPRIRRPTDYPLQTTNSSRVIIRVDGHVVLRQVARPDGALALAQFALQVDGHLGDAELLAHLFRVERDGLAVAVDRRALQRERRLVRL